MSKSSISKINLKSFLLGDLRRFLFTLIALCIAIFANAQTISETDQAILEKIKEKNAAYTTIEADFAQVKHMPFLEEDMLSGGKLYYSKPEKLSMWYTDPAGDLMLINGDNFVMIASGKRNETTSKNAKMRAMKMILSACMEGDVLKAGTTSVSCEETPKYYIVTAELAGGKNNKSNISKVVVHYDKKDGSVAILRTEEPDGTFNNYELINKKINQPVEEEKFISQN